MEDKQRKLKKAVIAVIFFVIIGGLGFLIFRGIFPPSPEPTPNPIANLSPIEVGLAKIFNISDYDYDFLAKVTNPNTGYGSPEADYEIKFFDYNNSEIYTQTGSFYILPGQTKYVVESPIKLQEQASRAELTITSVDWQQLDPLALAAANLITKNSSYSLIGQTGLFGKAGGSILNNSDFDLNSVDVNIVLLDAEQNPIAVNKTKIDTFLAGTTRGFEVTWFESFVGNVVRVDAEPNTNVFENSNFLRQYGGNERFKQSY